MPPNAHHAFLLALTALYGVTASAAPALDRSSAPTGASSFRRILLAGARYERGDAVTLYANKVGPFHNPSEVRARASATLSAVIWIIGDLDNQSRANADAVLDARPSRDLGMRGD